MYSTLFSLLAIAIAAPGCKVPSAPVETSATPSVESSAAPAETSSATGQKGTFGLMTIHSGSDVQYQAVKLSSDGHLSLNGETDATFTYNDDTSLFVNGKGVDLFEGFPVVQPSGSYSKTWGIENQHLTFNGADSFTVCLENNRNVAFSGQGGAPSTCKNPVGVSLRVVQL